VDILTCPLCGAGVSHETTIRCRNCNAVYESENGIPCMFVDFENKITPKVKSFYEKNPFPNYDGLENISDLVAKAEQSIFADLLNKQLPFNIRILEVGCGTGQLSNFLGISNREVFGTDMCLNSLNLAQAFKLKNSLENVSFYQMNLFKPIFKNESFHLVICNGVLHHTSDPFLGFQIISKLVKRGGYIIIGLYNTYGRLITDMRRMIFNLSRDNFQFLDPLLSRKKGDQKAAWFLDQYKHPHESKHTLNEAFSWFDKEGFQFVNSIPKAEFFSRFSADERLFRMNPRGNWLDHLLVQLKMIYTGNTEGGFFLFIGRRVR
jgi:SAM-dependent methyltransferase